jgi:hypothetical protein
MVFTPMLRDKMMLCILFGRDNVQRIMGKIKPKSTDKTKSKSKSQSAGNLGYMDDTQKPLNCLVFLLPLLILYEVGMVFSSKDIFAYQMDRVIAFQLVYKFIALFGFSAIYFPGLLVVAALLFWQLTTANNWKINTRTVLGMYLESTLLAIPLLVLSNVASSHSTTMAALDSQSVIQNPWMSKLLLSVGAGIYEELLFRLLLILILDMLFQDVFKLGEGPSIFIIMFISAILFSLYHYLGDESFRWNSFMFRMMAGGYLAGVYILRGFGVVVGCHMIYDVAALIMNSLVVK